MASDSLFVIMAHVRCPAITRRASPEMARRRSTARTAMRNFHKREGLSDTIPRSMSSPTKWLCVAAGVIS